jgi:hypothetical protein
MVIGSSNAGRLTKALNDAHYSVNSILNGNWRVTRESCEAMAETVKKQIELENPGAIVLFMLDASTFYVKKDDGSLVLPRKGGDGVFHIEGDLVVASPDTQAAHLDAMRPILDAIGRRPCLVVSPMPRYITEGCCSDASHAANRNNRHFRLDMQYQLDGFAKRIKNMLFNQNRRNMRVLDSTYDSRHMADNEIWFCDPVHPLEGIYRRIAAGVIKTAASLKDQDDRQQLKRRRVDSWDNPQQTDRKPREATYSRLGDRDEHESSRGGYRGGRGGRGGRYSRGQGGHR